MTGALSHTSILAKHGGKGLPPIAYLRVGGSRLSGEPTDQDDLDTLDRIEAQLIEQAGEPSR